MSKHLGASQERFEGESFDEARIRNLREQLRLETARADVNFRSYVEIKRQLDLEIADHRNSFAGWTNALADNQNLRAALVQMEAARDVAMAESRRHEQDAERLAQHNRGLKERIVALESERDALRKDASWATTHRSELADLRQAFHRAEEENRRLREQLAVFNANCACGTDYDAALEPK